MVQPSNKIYKYIFYFKYTIAQINIRLMLKTENGKVLQCL